MSKGCSIESEASCHTRKHAWSHWPEQWVIWKFLKTCDKDHKILRINLIYLKIISEVFLKYCWNFSLGTMGQHGQCVTTWKFWTMLIIPWIFYFFKKVYWNISTLFFFEKNNIPGIFEISEKQGFLEKNSFEKNTRIISRIFYLKKHKYTNSIFQEMLI